MCKELLCQAYLPLFCNHNPHAIGRIDIGGVLLEDLPIEFMGKPYILRFFFDCVKLGVVVNLKK